MTHPGHTNNLNPFLTEIENRYPFLFEVSTYIAHCIENAAGIIMTEDEIGFIGAHLCASVEKMKRHQRVDHLYAVLFTMGSDPMAQFLLTKIQSFFSSKMYLDGPYALSAWDEQLKMQP